MPLPGGTEYDPFAEQLKLAREEQERLISGHDHGGGRPPLDPSKGKQVTLYLRQDVIDYLKDQVALDQAQNTSQAANQAIRKAMGEETTSK